MYCTIATNLYIEGRYFSQGIVGLESKQAVFLMKSCCYDYYLYKHWTLNIDTIQSKLFSS
jgi:hypothetical protein